MKRIQLILRFLCVSLLAGCGTPGPGPLKGSSFETQDLKDAVGARKVAISGSFVSQFTGGRDGTKTYTEKDYFEDPRTDHCRKIRADRPLEKSIAAWAPNQVSWEERATADLQITYSWTCESFYTDTAGGGAALAVFTLGAMPAVEDDRLKLFVQIVERKKKIFSKTYQLEARNYVNMWANKDGSVVQQNYANAAEVLIEKLTKDLSRDGVLEK